MKKNQLTTTKSTNLILGKSKSLMNITKKILESKNKGLAKVKASQELTTHKDITIIGDFMWETETQEDMDWDEAMEYAKNLRLGGYDDWRLPTLGELSEVLITLCAGISVTLGDDNWVEICYENEANKNYQVSYKEKGFAPYYYWSSTTYTGDYSEAWYVYFSNGFRGYYHKSESHYVRCVRAGQ